MQKSYAVVLILPVLLLGCQKNNAPDPNYTVQGIHRIPFQLNASGELQITQQAYQEVTGSLPITVVSSRSFVDLSTNTQHMNTTFKITNNTGQSLTGLSFLPVNIDDLDSDPGNNTVNITAGSSPYAKIKYYNGTDASLEAGCLLPETAQTINLKTGDIEADPQSMTYSSNLNVQGLTLTQPSGATLNLYSNAGWVIPGTLAAGASTHLTIATKYPRSTDPSKNPYTYSLMMVTLASTL